MPRFSLAHVGLSLAMLCWGTGHWLAQGRDTGAQPQSVPQSKSTGQNRVTSQQSITVEAFSTPEEKEEGRINDLYQPVYSIQQKHDCDGAIEKYRTVVIPVAEQAKFNIPKNKFLFLAYRGIADCDMDLKKYVEAEEIYQKLFDYLPVWPGTDDSGYPINFRSLGLARMALEKWEDAESPLQKSVTIFDEQINRASKSDADFERNEMANDYRMSQDSAMYLLAVVYFREKRNAEALRLLERAYSQATQFHAPAAIIKKIVDGGVAISIGSGDLSSGVTWSKRALSAN
jgi:tetratricopeptide (TPR) repeat protein